ncbi:MAG: YqhA family protein [Planctomycetota bacterium]
MSLSKLIAVSRLALVLPVLGSLLLMLGLVVMGTGVIVVRAIELFQDWTFTPKAAKGMSITVIEMIDLFLVATVAYITAVGIFKLFISQHDEQLLKRVKIEKLDDLEAKIVGVLVAALAVSYLGQVAEAEDGLQVLYSGVGIALVVGVLVLFLRLTRTKE